VSDVDDVKSEADAAAAAAAEAASRLGLSGPPVLLRSGANHVFRVGDGVVRVTAGNVDVRAHVALIRWLAAEGLPVPTPIADPLTINGFHVTAWEYVDTHRPIDYRQLGVAIGTLHGLSPAAVGRMVPLPWCADAPWLQLEANLEIAAHVGVVSGDDIDALRNAVGELEGWGEIARGEELVVCHGDLHPSNLGMRDETAVVLDWDAICLGPAAWDHVALMTWAERWGGDPADYASFAAGYGVDFRDSEVAWRLARVRLLSPTINMIIAGAASTRCADEARVRMRFWRGEPEAPTWHAQ